MKMKKLYRYFPGTGLETYDAEIRKDSVTVMSASGLTGQRVPQFQIDSGERLGYWTTPRKAIENWITGSEEYLKLRSGVISAEDTRLWREEIKKAKERLSEMK